MNRGSKGTLVDLDESQSNLILWLVSYVDHEFSNQLQLIDGWLKLGDVAKAREAALEAFATVRTRSSLRHLLAPRDAAVILRWLGHASLKGVATNVQVLKRLDPLSPGARHALMLALEELVHVCYRMELQLGDAVIISGYLMQQAEGNCGLAERLARAGACRDGDQVTVRIDLVG
ncbi:MAG: Spo0B domain-containing protein [Bacillota bacterium]